MQAVLVLRWFKDATDIRLLARDAGISIATANRYPHEGIDVIAPQAPDLPDRARSLPALYPAAAAGLPTLTDKGYTGGGIDILVSTKGGDKLDVDTRTRNKLICECCCGAPGWSAARIGSGDPV